MAATIALTPTRIELTWDPSVDPGSAVDHYVIYRDGRELTTTAATTYTDSDVTLVTPYTYEITAVNRDARESDRSTVVHITIPGIAAATSLSFALSLGAFLFPQMLGGGRVQVLATAIYERIQTSYDIPAAAALAMLFLVLVLALLGLAASLRSAVSARFAEERT